MKKRWVVEVDITDTPVPYDDVSEGELETAEILRMDPMHFHRMLDLYMNVIGKQAQERIAERKRLAAEQRTVVD